jgi:hypothetical protein
VAESELSVLTRQCLDRRIAQRYTVGAEACAWARDRNAIARMRTGRDVERLVLMLLGLTVVAAVVVAGFGS